MNDLTRLHPACLALILLACGGADDEPAAPEQRETAGGHDHASGHPGAAHGHGHHDHAAHRHDFSDVERFAAIFDDPERDEWQRPAEVVALLALDEGMTVVDLGAGTGYFVPHLAAAVGPSGRVLALDVEEAMVAHMRERFDEAGLEHAEARTVAPDDPGLEPASVDRILVVDTWHHVAEREAYAARLRETLRPGGTVTVVDFTADSPRGPPPAMRLTADEVSAELAAGGLEPAVLEESLPWQYVVRARRPVTE
ncbi:MAG TPA: methyltransferase domain-containing protein [Sandaracinaceae bacterium LLY-WYZ-13_1]|nr:methyltransferase domain-containing protein [Sandaracinaceae bacterium LLY-WYZ-13_1]